MPPRFSKRGPPLVSFGEAPRYRDFVTHGFTAWAPSIREAYWDVLDWAAITRTPLNPSLRFEAKPSELSHSGWLALYDLFTRFGRDEGGRSVQGADERLLEQQSRLSKQRRGRAIRPPRQRPRNDS